MKLAEALIKRADGQKAINELKNRLLQCLLVQEGENPPENPNELLDAITNTVATQINLVERINFTNIATSLPEPHNYTIMAGIARRDYLTWLVAFMRELATRAVPTQRYSTTEFKWQSTLDPKVLNTKADELTKERRELDTAIQAAGWNTDLVD